MSQTVYIWGLPSQRGFPYISLSLDRPIEVGTTINYGDDIYEIHQVDEVTHENQLQNAYARPKNEGETDDR